MLSPEPFDFDVAIVGGGPAGLSAALTLSRACRIVALFDHQRPRNFAATSIHCYLGRDGVAPSDLRQAGRIEAARYGVAFFDNEVTGAVSLMPAKSRRTAFEIYTEQQVYRVRAVVLATGVMDRLPQISGLKERYASSVHHCHYCDGWEHRGQHLVALGSGSAVAKLAATLRGWSHQVTACTNGSSLSADDRQLLERLQTPCHTLMIRKLQGHAVGPQSILFDDDTTIPFDGMFFSSGQAQRSPLPRMLGCDCNDDDLIVTIDKQCTSALWVYLAGDATATCNFQSSRPLKALSPRRRFTRLSLIKTKGARTLFWE